MTPRPVTLRPDLSAARETAVAGLARAAVAIARGRFEPGAPVELARRSWGEAAARDVSLLLRGATAPATTVQPGWAGEFAHVVLQFISSLVPQSAGADLLGRGLQLRFDGAASISLPVISPTPANFVGQAKPIPVAQFVTSAGVKLEPHKLAIITLLTQEMITSSGAEAIMRDALSQAAALALDGALFSSFAGSPDQPPGLLAGATPLTPSSASVLSDAMLADLSALAGTVARVAGGGGVVFIAAPEQAVAISIGAPMFQYPVLSTAALPKGTVAAVAASALVSASEPLPMIDASREATVHRDSAPSEIVTSSGVISAPTMSVYQTDAVAVRLRLPLAWAVRAPGAIAWASNVIW